MKEKKTAFFTFTLTPSDKAEIIKRAEQERRKPSEFVYLLVMDNLKGSQK